MPAGKLSAQSGHAYESSIINAQSTHPKSAKAYKSNAGGSKVTLEAKNANQLIRSFNEAKSAGLPCSVVVDSQHILLPHFDGAPIITAIGIGPCTKAEARHITKRLNCVK